MARLTTWASPAYSETLTIWKSIEILNSTGFYMLKILKIVSLILLLKAITGFCSPIVPVLGAHSKSGTLHPLSGSVGAKHNIKRMGQNLTIHTRKGSSGWSSSNTSFTILKTIKGSVPDRNTGEQLRNLGRKKETLKSDTKQSDISEQSVKEIKETLKLAAKKNNPDGIIPPDLQVFAEDETCEEVTWHSVFLHSFFGTKKLCDS